MNVQCGICKDAIDVLAKAGDGGSVASALPCGHVFHSPCINQWFAESKSSLSGTCPQCRGRVSKKQVLKLFLDLVPLENYEDDPAVIKGVNDCLKRDIESLHDQLAHKSETTDKLIKMNTGLRERLLELEHKVSSAETNERLLKLTHTKLNSKTKDWENALLENKKLAKQLNSLRASTVILNGSLTDAKDALLEMEKEDMAALVYTYKKDSEKLLKRHDSLLREMARLQEESRKLQKELLREKEEKSILSRIAEMYKPKKVESKQGNRALPSSSSSAPAHGSSSSLPSSHLSTPKEISFVDLRTPSPPKQPRSTLNLFTDTPAVISPKRNCLVNSKSFKVSNTLRPKAISFSDTELVFPVSYDGLGGHSRVEEFPSSRLPKRPKIVKNVPLKRRL